MVDNTLDNLEEKTQTSRLHLNKVMIDSTALLNIVKHCREADWKIGAKGMIMGVIKENNILFITQSMPEVTKS